MFTQQEITHAPSEYSSGEKEQRGHITRQGRAELRAVMVEVAWRAIDEDAVLDSIYQRIKVRRGGKRAIVAVARRLIGRIRGCFKNKEFYKVGFMSRAQGICAAYRAEAATVATTCI